MIEYCGKLFAWYMKKAGKKEVVSFYDYDTQIGQLTKPNCVVNNLDRYLVHLLDGVLDKKIISLFVVYYDFLYHNHSGEIAKGRRANTTYTFDKNSKKYNKRYIITAFNCIWVQKNIKFRYEHSRLFWNRIIRIANR